ncbi:hypothetical protein F2Q69_00025423 [Brassica cretica]|uniref:Uncharacterized protein n=1 Tax=Brassica cretica TaxID=69181 RepID=A0A8S9QFV6_BRACR|nr:hypothetical protein F2Q69_00025423 [Brassica cretica]
MLRRRKPCHEKNNGGSLEAGSGKDVQDTTLKDTKISDQGISGGNVNIVENLCSADPMLCGSPTATNDGLLPNSNIYTLNNIPDAENNLGFMNNGDEESSDLFYGRGDMGNFEDVDNMLSTNNEDENGYTIMGGSAQENSSENVYDTKIHICALVFVLQVDLEKKQTGHLHQPDWRNDGHSENSFNLQHSGTSSERVDTNQYCPPSTFQQPGVPYSHYNCEQPSDQISAENQPNPSSASNESYTSSNQAQSVNSLQGPTVDERCRKGFGKRVNLQPGQDLLPSFAATTRKTSKTNPMVSPDAAPTLNTGLENDHRKASAKVETSNMQEISCVSFVVDDISLEATSFRQLQQVVEQVQLVNR